MNIQGFSPMISAPVQAQSANAAAATGGTGGSSSTGSSSSTSASNLQSTFLNLLVTELQNQDPTSPVDPTQMVSQMVSLNQLDQLISINQTLANMSSSASGSAPAGNGSTVKAPVTQTSIDAKPAQPTTGNNLAFTQVPAQYAIPTNNPGLMNLYGGFGIPVTNPISKQTGAR
jgi:flagellar hook assembly protein FlgD